MIKRLAIAGLAAVLLAGPAAGVQDPDQADLPRLLAQHRDEQVRATRLRADADQARAEVARLERAANTARETGADDDDTVAAQRARLADLSQQETALATRLAAERGRLSRLLSALQMMSRKPPPPLLVPAKDATDTVRASILIRAVTPELKRRADALADAQTQLIGIRREALLASEALLTGESDRLEARGDVEARLAAQTRLAAVLGAEADQAERAAEALETRIRALGGQPRPIEDADTATVAALPAGRASLTPPVAGRPDTRFGSGSSGWTWRISGRTDLAAPASGRVVYSGPLEHWGQVVILDLGPGWRAVVAGMDETAVAVGQRIGDGEHLGSAPGGAEVYFELRRDDQPMDPARWLQ